MDFNFTPLQETLLDSALRQGDVARLSWLSWVKQSDLTHVDFESARTLPLVYANLHQQALQVPQLPFLRQKYQQTYAINRYVFTQVARQVSLFNQEKIPTLILKGAALAADYYPNLGMRFMRDFDLLVQPDSLARVVECLESSGWRTLPRQIEGNPALFVERTFIHSSGVTIDLHWHLNIECLQDSADEYFWSESIGTQIDGVATRSLHPAHLLLHILHHSIGVEGGCLRWVPDSLMILKHCGSFFNWDKLLQAAETRKLEMALIKRLPYLEERYPGNVPQNILSHLGKRRVPWIQILEFNVRTSSWLRKRHPLFAILGLWLHHLRWSQERSLWFAWFGFPSYLYERWGRPTFLQFMKEGAIRFRRLWRRQNLSQDFVHSNP